MAVPRFYVGPAPLAAGTIRLSPDESHHARATRRLVPGDEVVVFDGRGGEGHGRILKGARAQFDVELTSIVQRPADCPVALTLAVSMPKGPRQDVLVEKCTELGMAALWPMDCRRSLATFSQSRLAKWRRTAIEACKQSQRAWLPEFTAPRSLAEVLDAAPGFDRAYVADPAAAAQAPPGRQAASILVLIGPEGGLTDEELAAARACGLEGLRLGRTLLRTETAAIASAAKLLLADGC